MRADFDRFFMLSRPMRRFGGLCGRLDEYNAALEAPYIVAAAQRATHDRRARYALAVLPGKEQEEEEEDRETGRIFEDGNEKKADDRRCPTRRSGPTLETSPTTSGPRRTRTRAKGRPPADLARSTRRV